MRLTLYLWYYIRYLDIYIASKYYFYLFIGFNMSKIALEQNSPARKLRIELIGRVQRAVRKRAWSQAEAAEIMGVSQPRVSDLMRDKSERFSLDMLTTMLYKLGERVSFTPETV
jgi:predicted XRE-type DNA-binding protein